MAFAEDTSRVEHLRELDKADKAGCIVVLPPANTVIHSTALKTAGYIR